MSFEGLSGGLLAGLSRGSGERLLGGSAEGVLGGDLARPGEDLGRGLGEGTWGALTARC